MAYTDVTPVMTSDTAPSPNVVTESSFYTASYKGWQVYDDPTGAWWIADGTTGWVKLDFGSGQGKILTKYTITATNLSRVPEDWTFQGSNNDSDWVTLDTVSGHTDWDPTTQTFEFENSTSYRYYKINITKAVDGASLLAILQMALFTGSSGTAYEKTFNETINVSDTILRALTKTFSETITLSEVFARALTKVFSETITLSEIFSKIHGYYRTFSEAAITISDTIRKATARIFSETVSMSETFVRAIFKTLSDTVTITDWIEKLLDKAYAFPSYIKSAVVKKATGFISGKDKPKGGKASSVDKPEGV